MPFGDGTEAEVVDALREDGDLSAPLVAVDGGGAIVATSPSRPSPSTAVGLGPLSVLPALRRRGIGGALVRRGLEAIRRRGARGCALIGSPDHYGRFGFEGDGRLTHGDLDARLVQPLTFVPPRPVGRLRLARAFGPE